MLSASTMAFLRHLMAFTLTACLVYEFVTYRNVMSVDEARRIQRMDLLYGVSAGLLLVIGLLRVFRFEKGVSFYMHSPFFWVKMAMFLIVALLSIYPTIRYIQRNKSVSGNQRPEIRDNEFKRTRLFLSLEMAGIVIILLAAPLMARGVGIR